MSKYSAASDGRGNVKVFCSKSGVTSYTLNKGPKTKINNVQVSGDTLTVTSTDQYGTIKADVYNDINKGIMSYSNIIGREDRAIKPTTTSVCQTPSYSSPQNISSSSSSVDEDSSGGWIIFLGIVMVLFAVVFPMAIGTIVLGFIVYCLPWICKKEDHNDFDALNVFAITYLFLYVCRDTYHTYPPLIPVHNWTWWGYWSALILIAGFITYGTKRLLDNIIPSCYMTLGLVLICYRLNYIEVNNFAVSTALLIGKAAHWLENLFN